MRRIPGLVSINWCIFFFANRKIICPFFLLNSYILFISPLFVLKTMTWNWKSLSSLKFENFVCILFLQNWNSRGNTPIPNYFLPILREQRNHGTRVITRLFTFKVRLGFLRFGLLKNLIVFTDFQRHWVNERNMFDDVLMYIYHLTVTDPIYILSKVA